VRVLTQSISVSHTLLVEIIFSATRQANVRAVVSAGWVIILPTFLFLSLRTHLIHLHLLVLPQGGLGGVSIPSHVFIINNVPHDWLFDKDRISIVVHHGGAGTTAVGLKYGRPTVVVPFFGDQKFWGR
jgi:sterol 3beta-glucosyltransferase